MDSSDDDQIDSSDKTERKYTDTDTSLIGAAMNAKSIYDVINDTDVACFEMSTPTPRCTENPWSQTSSENEFILEDVAFMGKRELNQKLCQGKRFLGQQDKLLKSQENKMEQNMIFKGYIQNVIQNDSKLLMKKKCELKKLQAEANQYEKLSKYLENLARNLKYQKTLVQKASEDGKYHTDQLKGELDEVKQLTEGDIEKKKNVQTYIRARDELENEMNREKELRKKMSMYEHN